MKCPFCSSLENRVIDSRLAREGSSIRRRRTCASCSGRFTTYESVVKTVVEVVKQDGRTEPFDRDKALRSLRLPCQKRPIPQAALNDFVVQLESELAANPRKHIRSDEVGDRVLTFLRDLDHVAYVRYASVYRSFKSVEEFMMELERLREESL
jgi:transcriptional repressor NrdR